MSEMTRTRVMVGDSVYEPATLSITDGRLYVEFDAEDLDNLTFTLADLPESVLPAP